ncbi:MAG: ATP-binding protein, partial [Myxococcota bacterium]
MSRLRHLVGAAIVRDGLWSPGARVAVAVSGGLDSVALLDLLLATARWHGGALEVATVDHGLRPDSAADAAFVEGLAAA